MFCSILFEQTYNRFPTLRLGPLFKSITVFNIGNRIFKSFSINNRKIGYLNSKQIRAVRTIRFMGLSQTDYSKDDQIFQLLSVEQLRAVR